MDISTLKCELADAAFSQYLEKSYGVEDCEFNGYDSLNSKYLDLILKESCVDCNTIKTIEFKGSQIVLVDIVVTNTIEKIYIKETISTTASGYEYDQAVESDHVTIYHNLGYNPTPYVTDWDGNSIDVIIKFPAINSADDKKLFEVLLSTPLRFRVFY